MVDALYLTIFHGLNKEHQIKFILVIERSKVIIVSTNIHFRYKISCILEDKTMRPKIHKITLVYPIL